MERRKESIGRYIPRELYLKRIENYLNTPIIKILKGMRRVGKSVILKFLIQKLIEDGIPEENILYINKESVEYDDLKNYKDLYFYVKQRLDSLDGSKYLLVDEVQDIDEWERAILSLFSEEYADIIITGSNASLLSSDLATYNCGRYVEIPIYPLTFKEFLQFRRNVKDLDSEFRLFLRYGGLPGIHQLTWKDEILFNYLNSIINTVFYKDIVSRYKIRDVSVLENIIKYLFDNIGNITSAKRITEYFRNQKLNISVDTVLNYIQYCESCFLIEKARRFDIKGKRYLEYYDKFFLNDVGIRHGFIGYRDKDINGLLENVVYNELRTRGYNVSIGVLDSVEVDFIAETQNEKKYIQVCSRVNTPELEQREFGNLKKIKDNYEKIVLSLDKFYPEEKEGIRHAYLIDFLVQ
jgi:predicted AAA+ superfamily ATPase